MTIGLPLIGAVSSTANRNSAEDDSGNSNYHNVRISSALSLKSVTTDDIELETGGSVWHAGFALAQYLTENPSLVKDKNIVELGAGCGLAGLTAAALGARSVTLTDISTQQSHLQRNIDLNYTSYNEHCEHVKCATLFFGDDKLTYQSNHTLCSSDDILDEKKKVGLTGGLQDFDVILGADIGYDLSLHEPIAVTLTSLLRQQRHRLDCVSTDTPCSCPVGRRTVILVEEIRWKDIHEWYMTTLSEAACTLSSVHSAFNHCEGGNASDKDADDNGNNDDDKTEDKSVAQLSCVLTKSFLEEKGIVKPSSGSIPEERKYRRGNSIHLLTLQADSLTEL